MVSRHENATRCKSILTYLGNLHQLSAMPRIRSMKLAPHTLAQTIHSYDRIRFFVNTFAKRLFPWTMISYPDHLSLHASLYNGGRGIVFTAGNHQAGELLTVIPSLRRLGCTLPIEIMYLGDEDLDEDMRDRLEELDDVVTRDLRLMIEDDGWHLAGKGSTTERNVIFD
jgi:alpha 1,3-mannosyltransferase